MHTEHLHRTLSPQAYASLLDQLRQGAESEQRQAVQTFVHSLLLAWPRQLLQMAQRSRHPVHRPHTIEAA